MFIELKHANLKDGETPRIVALATPLIFAIYYSDAHKCTHVLSAGGAIMPVLNTKNEVLILMEKANANYTSARSWAKPEDTRSDDKLPGGDKGKKLKGRRPHTALS